MNEELDMLAAEFALGTLDASERAMVAARRLREPDLDAAIMAWEARLGPLSETVPSIAPPADLFNAIEAAIDGSAAVGAPSVAAANTADGSAEVIALRRRVSLWRGIAGAAMAAAAALAVTIGVTRFQTVETPQNFVAVLQKDAASPAFLVSVDIISRSLTVRPVAAEAQAGKSYELWLVNESLPAPRSLGLIQQAGFTTSPKLTAFSPEQVRNSVLAVSLEPEGGSTTGVPTGPVLFTGKLVQSEP
jgi:anti-sigma-K factor RskA